jgi:hypothetical protein
MRRIATAARAETALQQVVLLLEESLLLQHEGPILGIRAVAALDRPEQAGGLIRRDHELALVDLRESSPLGLRSRQRLPGRRAGQPRPYQCGQSGYQREVREGLRGLLSPDMTAWRLPAEPALSRKARSPGFEYLFLGDERAGVLGGIANLVLEAGDRLRACRQCGGPFVAKENRQYYCTPTCSQRARNRRRKPRQANARRR